MRAITPLRSTTLMERASPSASTVAARIPRRHEEDRGVGDEDAVCETHPQHGEEDTCRDEQDDRAEVGSPSWRETWNLRLVPAAGSR